MRLPSALGCCCEPPLFAELVAEMVREDLKAAERDELVKKHGYAVLNCHE